MNVLGKLLFRMLTVACLVAIAATAALALRHQIQLRFGDRQTRDLAEPDLGSIDPPGALWPTTDSPDADAQPAAPVDNSAALAVIQNELRDATPEEREIWYAELKQRTPDQIREILSLHRRMWPVPPALVSEKIELSSAEAPKPKRLLDGEASPRGRKPAHTAALIESSIRAIESAEQVILNNIANASTIGFKRSRPVFSEESQRPATDREEGAQPGGTVAVGLAIGTGTRLAGTQVDHSQGRLRQTKQAYDLAIEGEGYFQINDGKQLVYTRAGSFSTNKNGQIVLVVNGRSHLLEPAISVPHDATKIVISRKGVVSVLPVEIPGSIEIGTIRLARFINPAGLAPLGNQLFAATSDSGFAQAIPEQAGLGEIHQGFLEAANVDLADELSEMRRLREQLQALVAVQGELGGASLRPVELDDMK